MLSSICIEIAILKEMTFLYTADLMGLYHIDVKGRWVGGCLAPKTVAVMVSRGNSGKVINLQKLHLKLQRYMHSRLS